MANGNELETRFTVNLRDMERELRRLQQLTNRATERMAQSHEKAARSASKAWENSNIGASMNRQLQTMGATIRQYAPMIASLFAGREALNAAETWTRFSNSLKVAGLEGANLKSVQDSLFNSAVKNGVALEPLGKLYSQISQSAGELGATQQQLVRFTGGVTAALRVQGGDAASASGALMQLSQAMASGTVRAEEWNSINEGARPILEAVAAGWEKQGMTVAKLRAIMLDGKLTSSAFFEAFLRGSTMLEEKAAKAPLTVAQSMTVLHTSLTKYIGETNSALGITDRIAQAINWLANNIQTVATALTVVGGVYAATFLPALARSVVGVGALTAATVTNTVASASNTAALIARIASLHGVSTASATAAVASRALGASLALVGGPIGIAIMGVAAAVGYLGVSSAKASLETAALNDRINQKVAALDAADVAAAKNRAETGNLSQKEYAAAVQTAALTGEVHKLKDAYYLAAAAAKALAIASARAEFIKSSGDMRKARAAYEGRVEAERRKEMRAYGPGDPMDRKLGIRTPTLTKEQERAARGRAIQTEEGQTFAKSVRVTQGDYRTWQEQRDAKLDTFGTPKPTGTTGGGKPSGKNTGGSAPKDNTDASADAIRAAERAYKEAVWASATTMEERHQAALEQLELDHDDQKRRIEQQVKDKQISAEAGKAALAEIEKAHTQKKLNLEAQKAIELQQRANEMAKAQADLEDQAKRLEADELDIKAQFAKSLREKHSYERQALKLRQAADDAQFKVEQDQLALDREKLGLTQEEIARLRAKAEANREADKRNQNTQQDNQQGSERPGSFGDQMRDWAGSFGDFNTQLSNIAKGGINDIINGLTDAVMGAKSFKEAFTDMAKAVIAQLIQMAIRFLIFEAIGMAFGVKGLGKAAIGIAVGKNAKGTDNFAGGLTMVGESGPELMALPKGTQIGSNNLLRSALSQTKAGTNANAQPVINVVTNVNAQDAVLSHTVKGWIAEANTKAVMVAKKTTTDDLRKQSRNSFVR